MNRLMLPPLLAGYAFTPGNNLREQKTEGGMPRRVIKYVDAVHTVAASIYLRDERAQQYFWAFWRKNNARKWLWDIPVDLGILETCECNFSTESLPAEQNRGGDKLVVSFSIFVEPITRDADFDQSIIDAWENGLINVVDDIEKIPNVWLPNAVGV